MGYEGTEYKCESAAEKEWGTNKELEKTTGMGCKRAPEESLSGKLWTGTGGAERKTTDNRLCAGIRENHK